MPTGLALEPFFVLSALNEGSPAMGGPVGHLFTMSLKELEGRGKLVFVLLQV